MLQIKLLKNSLNKMKDIELLDDLFLSLLDKIVR